MTRRAVIAGLALALAAPAASAADGLRTVAPAVPAGMTANEPKITVDPSRPARLVAAAQVTAADGPRHAVWRSADGGATWTAPRLLGGTRGAADGFAVDPVLAAGRGGELVLGGLMADVDPAAGTFVIHAGTYASSDGGRTFPAFGSADLADDLCFTGPPPCEGVDKPALAVDRGRGRFSGRAYLVWIRERTPPVIFATTLRLAASADGGRTYGRHTVLDRRVFTSVETDPEWNAQVAVRPDGTVDVVWNTVRDGRPLIVHAASHDGGATFGRARTVVALDPTASVMGIVSSLAVSPGGRRAVCWSQSATADPDDQRIRCVASRRAGAWSRPQALPGPPGARQYLPVAAFEGRHLWVASYASTASRTRLLLVRAGRAGGRFGAGRTLRAWPFGAGAICGFTPAECGPGQIAIGDSISAAAIRGRVSVAYVEPARPATRILVSTVRTP